MRFIKLFSLPLGILILSLSFTQKSAATTFNRLVEEKTFLEKQFGIQDLECFPFTRNIGDHDRQKQLIENCLAGVRTLKNALARLKDADYRMIGISTRFIKTGGFHAALVPWNAGEEEMAQFLGQRLSPKEQGRFLDRIFSLKKSILRKIRIGILYCAMNISNEDCLQGYENLAAAPLEKTLAKTHWREIVITDVHEPQENPYKLALKFDDPPVKMRNLLMQDVDKNWGFRKKTYEEIQSRFEEGFRDRLQLENLFCAPDLSRDECLLGAANLFKASENDNLQQGSWGRVMLNRYNTLIEDDHNLSVRYDLPAEEMVAHLSKKPTTKETTANTVLAEKLETRTKNNPSKLRAVCDLEGLPSELCLKGFQTFIRFVRKNRDYRVRKPWTNLMFVDGTQLGRINFALNSSARNTYIYIDANSDAEEFSNILNRFRGQEKN